MINSVFCLDYKTAKKREPEALHIVKKEIGWFLAFFEESEYQEYYSKKLDERFPSRIERRKKVSHDVSISKKDDGR